MSRTYEQQVLEQIEQYRDTTDMHDLPAIYHVWSGAYVGPGLQEVFGVSDINSFYVEAFAAAAGARPGAVPTYLSLGCGDGAVEIAIARTLLDRGISQFRFICVDLSDILLDRFRAAVPAHLADRFEIVLGDLNTLSFDSQFDAVMANHSLHHMVDLEGIFAFVHANLTDGGVFVTSDMIGRNGHQRWPEARLLVDFFWPFLTPRQRDNALLHRNETRFIDHDCSGEGFEGVRAQDILGLILKQGFHPWKFFGFGGAIDVFVDRCFGHNFDPANESDTFLLHRVAFMNDLLLDAGLLTPTMMLGYFTKSADRGTVAYRGRAAQASVRDVGMEPNWLSRAQRDFARAAYPDEFVFRGGAAPAIAAAPVPVQGGEHLSDVLAALRDAQADAAAAKAAGEQQALRLRQMEESSSWQLTAPLRVFAKLLRRAIVASRQARATRRVDG